jgi:hypothetical protein
MTVPISGIRIVHSSIGVNIGTMRFLVRSIVAVSVVGALHCITGGRPARFAGIRLPGTAAQHALTIGTPLSAPPLMLVALVIAARRGRVDAVRLLSAIFIVGILGEPDTWAALRRPSGDPLGTACAGLYIALPGALIARSCYETDGWARNQARIVPA